jgi:multiple sugar transport system substrate-binding protein
MTAAMAACGGSSKGDETAAGGKPQTGQLEGTLTVWDWEYESPTWGKALAALDKEFMQQHPGVKIKHVGQPFNNYNQLIESSFSAKSGPDAVMFNPGGAGILAWTKSLENLGDRITPQMKDNLTGWDAVSEGFDPAKGTYALPYGIEGDVFYYNKKLFKKAGLDPDKPPTTLEEMKADAAKLKAAGIVPFGGGNKEGYENYWWFSVFWPGVATPQQGLELADGKVKWTDPKVVNTFKPYVDLVKAGYFPPAYASTPLFPDAVNDFAAGKSAMFAGLVSSDASYVEFNKALGVKNVGVFEVPGVDAPKPNYLPIGPKVTWSITKFSDKKDLAWAYISFMVSEQAQKEQFVDAGVVPNDKRVDVSDSAPPQVQQMLEDFRSTPTAFGPHGLWPLRVSNDEGRQISLVLNGDKSLADALKAIQATAERPN